MNRASFIILNYNQNKMHIYFTN